MIAERRKEKPQKFLNFSKRKPILIETGKRKRISKQHFTDFWSKILSVDIAAVPQKERHLLKRLVDFFRSPLGDLV